MDHLDFGHGIAHEPKVHHPKLVESLAREAIKHIPGAKAIVDKHFSNRKTYRDLLPKKPQTQLMYEHLPQFAFTKDPPKPVKQHIPVSTQPLLPTVHHV